MDICPSRNPKGLQSPSHFTGPSVPKAKEMADVRNSLVTHVCFLGSLNTNTICLCRMGYLPISFTQNFFVPSSSLVKCRDIILPILQRKKLKFKEASALLMASRTGIASQVSCFQITCAFCHSPQLPPFPKTSVVCAQWQLSKGLGSLVIMLSASFCSSWSQWTIYLGC